MAVYHLAPDLGFPAPAHTLTESAEKARTEFLEVAAARRAAKAAPPDLVTHHVPPWRRARDGDDIGRAAGAFYGAAFAAGCDVTALVAGDAIEVRVDRGRIRAWWVKGRTTGVVMAGRKVTLAAAKAAL